jgi:hypothetical protein
MSSSASKSLPSQHHHVGNHHQYGLLIAGGRNASTMSSWFEAKESDEMPLGATAEAIGRAFGPGLDALASVERAKLRGASASAENAAETGLYVPDIPMFLCATRLVRDSAFVRSVLVHDERAPRTKPRLSWYDARDNSWVPRGWYADGLKADLEFYFGNGASASASAK